MRAMQPLSGKFVATNASSAMSIRPCCPTRLQASLMYTAHSPSSHLSLCMHACHQGAMLCEMWVKRKWFLLPFFFPVWKSFFGTFFFVRKIRTFIHMWAKVHPLNRASIQIKSNISWGGGEAQSCGRLPRPSQLGHLLPFGSAARLDWKTASSRLRIQQTERDNPRVVRCNAEKYGQLFPDKIELYYSNFFLV